jgi:transposase
LDERKQSQPLLISEGYILGDGGGARVATFVDTSEHLATQTCSERGCVGGPKGLKGLEIENGPVTRAALFIDRDVNAARNILRLGRQTLAEGSSIHVARLDGEDVTFG